MKPIIKAFDKYVEAGLKPLALYPNTKIPILKKWNFWNKDENRSQLNNDKTNIGLLLGDIVDVEGDSDEANSIINNLIGDYEHPIYKSKKSYHHIFLNPDPNLTLLKFDDIEFRGKNHQSVIPPSVVKGIRYEWQIVNLVFPIPPMPQALHDFYFLHQKKHQKKIIKGLKPGNVQLICSICKEKKYINEKRFISEMIAFKQIEIEMLWQCIKCRKSNIRPQVKKIKKIVKHENISDWRNWFCRK